MVQYAGSAVGGVIGSAPRVSRRSIGIALLPQAGVSIGLVHVSRERYPELSRQVAAVVLSAIVVNEAVGSSPFDGPSQRLVRCVRRPGETVAYEIDGV